MDHLKPKVSCNMTETPIAVNMSTPMIRCTHMVVTHMNSNTTATANAITTSTTTTSSRSVNLKSPRKNVENDYRVVHGWLKAMRDLSPPRRMERRKEEAEPLNKSDSDAAEIEYRAWMLKHPSALDKFDKIMNAAAGKRIAIFLDYDGTLSPIVKDPERAFMSAEMRAMVKDAATLFPISIITGRSREKVYDFVQLPELYYAGSHGMDIMGPAKSCYNSLKAFGTTALDKKGNEMVLFQSASEFTTIMDEVFSLLEESTRKIPGAKIEHNKLCVSVHFRRVKEENWLALAEQVQRVLNSYPNLRLTHGRKILEIRPLVAWNKGKALDYLLRALGLASRNDVFPIYIGDDQTDEDAFKVISRLDRGLSILVSTTAKKTDAMCSLSDPTEVLEFLRYLVKWRRRRMNRMTCI